MLKIFSGFSVAIMLVMKIVAFVLAVPLVFAQTPAPLDARASDPVVMGWMTGTPPPPGKTIRFSDGSSSRFPQTRWAFSNIRQLVPTRVVPRGNAAIEL